MALIDVLCVIMTIKGFPVETCARISCSMQLQLISTLLLYGHPLWNCFSIITAQCYKGEFPNDTSARGDPLRAEMT